MPQMSSMDWLLLMTYFLIIFYLFMIFIYFFYFVKSKKLSFSYLLKNMFMLKWY